MNVVESKPTNILHSHRPKNPLEPAHILLLCVMWMWTIRFYSWVSSLYRGRCCSGLALIHFWFIYGWDQGSVQYDCSYCCGSATVTIAFSESNTLAVKNVFIKHDDVIWTNMQDTDWWCAKSALQQNKDKPPRVFVEGGPVVNYPLQNHWFEGEQVVGIEALQRRALHPGNCQLFVDHRNTWALDLYSLLMMPKQQGFVQPWLQF